jgi:hypothetical protein
VATTDESSAASGTPAGTCCRRTAPPIPAGGADSRKTSLVIRPASGAATGIPSHVATSTRAPLLRRWDASPAASARDPECAKAVWTHAWLPTSSSPQCASHGGTESGSAVQSTRPRSSSRAGLIGATSTWARSRRRCLLPILLRSGHQPAVTPTGASSGHERPPSGRWGPASRPRTMTLPMRRPGSSPPPSQPGFSVICASRTGRPGGGIRLLTDTQADERLAWR